MQNKFYKKDKKNKIWWVRNSKLGVFEFSFDKKQVFNMFADYPYKLNEEQKAIFKDEEPYWADFFKDRK